MAKKVMGSFIGLVFKMPDYLRKIRAAENEIYLFATAVMQTNRGLMFDQEGAHNGHPKWAPLKFRKGQILTQRGTLRRSMAPRKPDGTAGPNGGYVGRAGNTITIGTKLFYAALMNNGTSKMPGGVLRPTKGKALKIPLPQGDKAGDAAKSLQLENARRALRKLDDMISRSQDRLRRMASKGNSEGVQKISSTIRKYNDRKAAIQAKMTKGQGGDKFIFRASVKIPARPFDTWNDQDQDEMGISLANKIASILRR